VGSGSEVKVGRRNVGSFNGEPGRGTSLDETGNRKLSLSNAGLIKEGDGHNGEIHV
jgi:hypothetical protein